MMAVNGGSVLSAQRATRCGDGKDPRHPDPNAPTASAQQAQQSIAVNVEAKYTQYHYDYQAISTSCPTRLTKPPNIL